MSAESSGAKRYEIGKNVTRVIVGGLERIGLLPRFEIPFFAKETYKLLGLARDPTPQEEEALKKKGIIFRPVKKLSYVQVVESDEDYFLPSESIIASKFDTLRNYLPPDDVRVGINPEHMLMHPRYESPDNQWERIKKYSEELQEDYPHARGVMLPATFYAQLVKAIQEETSQELLGSIFIGTLDMIPKSGGNLFIGRYSSGQPLQVITEPQESGFSTAALPAVIFIKK